MWCWRQTTAMAPSMRPLLKSGVEGEEARGDASGEGEEADGDVVGHDAGGGLGFDAEDAVGPHLVVVEVGYALGAEEHDAEVWTEHDDEGAEETGGDADEGGGEEVAGHAAEEAGVAVGEELPEAGERRCGGRSRRSCGLGRRGG